MQPSIHIGEGLRRTQVASEFDLNDYFVPHTHARRTLTVLADTRERRIVDGAQIEQTEHLQVLIQQNGTTQSLLETNDMMQLFSVMLPIPRPETLASSRP